MKLKKNYTSEEKTLILREHLENNVPISALAEKYGLHPNALYNWKKQLFEEAPQTLLRKSKKKEKSQNQYERRIAELEALLSVREGLIADLAAENFAIKKKIGGVDLTKNGQNRKLGMR